MPFHFGFTQTLELSVDPEVTQKQFEKNLDIEKDYLNKRYDGFFRQLQSYKDYQKMRVKRVLEHKNKREAREIERSKQRMIYKEKQAKMKKEEIDFDALMAGVKKERYKKRMKKRSAYIKRREIMDHLRRTTKKIPEDVDVGLRNFGQ